MSASTFRQTVAEVAARAKERLPEAVNGRIESAVRLVLAHDVTRLADGTIEVGSSSDPMKTYHLVGSTCTCTDFTQGKAPQGWCKHRISAGIDKRVRELLPVALSCEPFPDNDPEPEAPVSTPSAALPEAPASVNCHIQIAGRQVQLTLRDQDEARLLQRLQAVLAQYPLPQPPAPPASQGEGWCAVHTTAMHWNEGKGGRKGWYSHRLPDGQWCKGR